MNLPRSVVLALVFTLSSGLAVLADKEDAAYREGDYATALKGWRSLSERGHSIAQFRLGLMYFGGKGVLQDYAEAVKWWRLSAVQGQHNSQSMLGFVYENGVVVRQDNVMAHMWYNISAANGNMFASDERSNIAKRMTNVEIAKAQSMARECMNSGYKNCGR